MWGTYIAQLGLNNYFILFHCKYNLLFWMFWFATGALNIAPIITLRVIVPMKEH